MMTQMIADQVISLLAQHVERPAEQITPAARLLEDLELDSLDSLELMVALEDRFHIKIKPADLEPLSTVQDLIAFVIQRRARA